MPKVSSAHMDARRSQILDAAMVCFAAHGIRETTIKRICDQAQLSPGAVYRYFDNKQAILAAVYARSMLENRGFSDQIASSADPLQTIRALVRGMVGFIGDPQLQQEHHLSLRVHAEGLSDPEVAKSYTAIHRDVIAQVSPLLRDLQAQGRIPATLDVEYFMWVLLSAYQGLRVHALLDPSLDLERFGDALLMMVDASLKIDESVKMIEK